MMDAPPLMIGVDHVGLTVGDLHASCGFFRDCLQWQLVGGNDSYPARFVGDGHTTVTLWRAEEPDSCTPFNRRRNVGLHHLALRVASLEKLEALHRRVAAWPGVSVEFAPERSGAGPKTHFIVREPSGVRLEFAFDPRISGGSA